MNKKISFFVVFLLAVFLAAPLAAFAQEPTVPQEFKQILPPTTTLPPERPKPDNEFQITGVISLAPGEQLSVNGDGKWVSGKGEGTPMVISSVSLQSLLEDLNRIEANDQAIQGVSGKVGKVSSDLKALSEKQAKDISATQEIIGTVGKRLGVEIGKVDVKADQALDLGTRAVGIAQGASFNATVALTLSIVTILAAISGFAVWFFFFRNRGEETAPPAGGTMLGLGGTATAAATPTAPEAAEGGPAAI